MGPKTAIKLSELNQFISCSICKGYLIDATTLNDCLHSFCKSCIVKYIKNDHNDCPECNKVINESRPLDYIIHDRNKQDIVYKLVPQLYISELNKRLAAREALGIDENAKYILKRKFLNVILIMRKKNQLDSQLNKSPNPIYLRCPLTIKIGHLRKLLVIKYQLGANDKVTILHKGDIVNDEDQVSNIAQLLTFYLHYEISRLCSSIVKAEMETHDSNS